MYQNVLKLFPHTDFQEYADRFNAQYKLKDIVGVGDVKYGKRSLKGYSQRTCRFCSKSYPEVPFSNYSHLVSKLIGNSNLYSDFECDLCNEAFSKIENDLSNYLGASRTFLGLNDEKKTKGFDGLKLSIKSRSFVGHNILIIAPEDLERDCNIMGKSTLKYIKNPYTPSQVYKALLKSAISLISETEINTNYQSTLQYLSGHVQIEKGAVIMGFKLAFEVNFPLHMYIYQKKNNSAKIPTDVIAFYFQNNINVVPIPLHKNDQSFFGEQVKMPVPAPYFPNKKIMADAAPVYFAKDLSSNLKIIDEEESISIITDPEDLNNTWVYDPASDKSFQKEYSPEPIKYLIVARDGATFDPKQLSEFITQQMQKAI